MANIQELMEKANELKAKQKAINAEMKQQKITIAKEYVDGLSESDKAKQIAKAENILLTARVKADKLKATFMQDMIQVKADVTLAKDILEFVGYKSEHSMPKVKNAYIVNGMQATFKREGLETITIELKDGWEKSLKVELKKQGINGHDRVADNIVWKMQQAVKTDRALTGNTKTE